MLAARYRFPRDSLPSPIFHWLLLVSHDSSVLLTSLLRYIRVLGLKTGKNSKRPNKRRAAFLDEREKLLAALRMSASACSVCSLLTFRTIQFTLHVHFQFHKHTFPAIDRSESNYRRVSSNNILTIKHSEPISIRNV